MKHNRPEQRKLLQHCTNENGVLQQLNRPLDACRVVLKRKGFGNNAYINFMKCWLRGGRNMISGAKMWREMDVPAKSRFTKVGCRRAIVKKAAAKPEPEKQPDADKKPDAETSTTEPEKTILPKKSSKDIPPFLIPDVRPGGSGVQTKRPAKKKESQFDYYFS